MAITFKPAVRLIPNFECGKICKILGSFDKSVSPWNQEPGTLFSKDKIWRGELKTSGLPGTYGQKAVLDTNELFDHNFQGSATIDPKF